MLMTGADHHQVGFGVMGSPSPEQVGQPGYENYLNESSLSIAQMLKDAGYHTYMAGKWNLCADTGTGECIVGKPGYQSGFERAYENVSGFAPNHFSRLDSGIRENGEVAMPPEGVHGTTVFTDKLLEYIDDGRTADSGRRPFFAYAAYMSPHWPLQAPSDLIEKYESSGLYDEGYEAVMQARVERQRELGLFDSDAAPSPLSEPRAYYEGYEPPSAPSEDNGSNEDSYVNALNEADDLHVNYHRGVVDRSWELMSDNERRAQAKYMAIYAAMVEHMDQQIGRLIQHLKSIGEYDNTLIVFHSDNGAEGWPMNEDDPASIDEWVTEEPAEGEPSRLDRLGSVDQPNLAPAGHRTPILGLMYGRQWAEVSNTPLSMSKGFQSEGGIRTVAIMKLPGSDHGTTPYTGFTHVMDDTATILAVAGVEPPATPAPGEPDKVLYGERKEQQAVFPIAGHSLVETLRSNEQEPVWSTAFGTESYGRTALYSADGRFKARFTEPAFGPLDGHWELFRIDSDPGETEDLAGEYPDLVVDLKEEWLDYMDRVGGIYPNRPNGYYPSDPPLYPDGYMP